MPTALRRHHQIYVRKLDDAQAGRGVLKGTAGHQPRHSGQKGRFAPETGLPQEQGGTTGRAPGKNIITAKEKISSQLQDLGNEAGNRAQGRLDLVPEGIDF